MKNLRNAVLVVVLFVVAPMVQSCDNYQYEEAAAEIVNPLSADGSNDTGSDPSENTP